MDNRVEMLFRDGPRIVPGHIAEYLTDVDTLVYTFREAMDLATKARVSDHLNRIQQKVITEHFKEMRGF